MEYIIEDVILRLGPWEDLGPSNWVPRSMGRQARRNPAAPVALPAGEGVEVDHKLT
jgi:hypothetical protein